MISIIISSYNENYFLKLKNNIKETIGDVEYELIQIWNPGIMSISDAYNKGAYKTRYDNLLFIHEDVEFLSNNWGAVVLKYLQLNNVGICGLAGSEKYFNLPIGFETGIKKYRQIYLKHQKDEVVKSRLKSIPIKVRTLDGVFLIMLKGTWQKLRFNKDIKGFHFYDLDITLRASRIYQNYVIPEISLHHFSLGHFNNSWVKAILKLPTKDYDFDIPTKNELNFVRNYWYNRLANEDISILNRLKYVLKMGVDRSSRKVALHFLFRRFH